jgi:hypothetical protein
MSLVDSKWCSDDAHFYLNDEMNRQDMYVWASEHAHNIIVALLHLKKLWFTVSASGITVSTCII